MPDQDDHDFELQHAPANLESAYATVLGQPWTDLPHDLYIPPNALRVFLETFSGPLDLLLYLIRKENINILDIPIAKVTAQYLEYIDLMKEFHLELAAEYLVMAAMLAEIKSRLLLPQPKISNEEEGDPRLELVRKLQEYERYKKLATELDTLPRLERDIFIAQADTSALPAIVQKPPEIKLDALLAAFQAVLARAKFFKHHQIAGELLSVEDRIRQIRSQVTNEKFVAFHALFKVEEGRLGVVVTFIAILELLKQAVIEMVQSEVFGTIHIRDKTN